MAVRRSDPHKLDVAALAADAGRLEGEIDAHELERWRDMQSAPVDMPLPPVRWSARGEQRGRAGEAAQTWLHLQISAQAWLTCQRCLQPFAAPLEIDRTFRFVPTEGEAEALDADSEDDVLALGPSFDLPGLIEDELLLAWPLVPRHQRCNQPAQRASGEPEAAASPFAALATLKGGRAAKP
jgi:uncharacterized protein